MKKNKMTYILVQVGLILPKQPFDTIFSTLALLVTEIQVILYVYMFNFSIFISFFSIFFINIHEKIRLFYKQTSVRLPYRIHLIPILVSILDLLTALVQVILYVYSLSF